MKAFFYLVVLLSVSISMNAQSLIAVQNGAAPSFYTGLNEAITAAQDGDTLYLPGGSYDHVVINKRLHIVGVGHHPDSTIVTAMTILRGLSLNSGADNGSITGINFGDNSINFNSNLNGYIISRCFISGSFSYPTFPNLPNLSNIIFIENILGNMNIQGDNFNNFSLNNNIVIGQIRISHSVIKNNIFLVYYNFQYYPYPLYTYNCIVENNIFSAYTGSSSSNSIHRNNARGGVNGTDGYGNQGSGNILDIVSIESLFVNYDPAVHSGQNIYQANFRLLTDSPCKNAGKDGTDMGIYGGAYPWKDGSIPFNPHFQTFQVAPKTDANGNLNVNIKVAAQER